MSSQQTLHAISGNRVVYTDSRNGNADIFAFDFTFTPPLASLSTGAVSFGNQQVGVPRGLQTFRIMNGGNGHLDVTGLSFSTPDFYTTTPLPFSVLSGGSASVDVWFSPTTTGSRTGTITIVDNSPSSPESVSLSGYGINPIATLSPTSINFGNQQVSTISVPAGVTVTNTGVGC
ncbi:MAG TPA: choice-of-anchor D domain-containing protein [Vicinamibacterales bacterium]|nr:choice-of-anchor D domain-containing protein [Vicinamibacterales bacterium]